MTLSLTSPDFSAGGAIPAEFTCEGTDRAPTLRWTGVPAGTASFALIVDDPDAPDPAAPKRTYVHWVVCNIPGTATELSADVGLPSGTIAGRNDWDRPRYNGPCPPIGRHRYFFKLYALNTMLTGLTSPKKADLAAAMDGHVLARAELVGTYEKGQGDASKGGKPGAEARRRAPQRDKVK